MPDDDTASNVSTATARGGVLRSGDFKDGMVCRANHSVKHAIVTALHSVLPPELKTADSLLQRDADILPDLQGKYRPLVVLEKPRGRTPARIVLTTRFNKQPVQETDAVAQMLAVPLGNATPPWPANDSPRIRVTPEWTDPHSYVLAFAFFLQNGRGPKRFRKGGVEYKVEDPELEVIRRLCKARIEAMAAMSPEELDALKSSIL